MEIGKWDWAMDENWYEYNMDELLNYEGSIPLILLAIATKGGVWTHGSKLGRIVIIPAFN